MRAVILALGMFAAAGAASAQGYWPSQGPDEQITKPAPAAPDVSAREQAENAIKASQADPAGVEFQAIHSSWATSVRRGAFGDRIPGPVSIVCGQYKTRAAAGGYSGYAWFFVAIKHGQVLWADVDKTADGPGNGYYGCKNAGLADY